MISSSLDKRLLSCAGYVRAGAVFADIGTDHGYLPIFLLKQGIISRAYLCDVNEGPLNTARANVTDEGLLDYCEFVLTDGAGALSDKGITDYAICGMGGVLISRIIDAAPHLMSTGTRLILQPMTKQAHLRKYLASAGFEILSERCSYAEGKHYVTLNVEYTGIVREVDDVEAELGSDKYDESDRVEYLGYLEAKKRVFEKTIAGMTEGNLDTSSQKEMLNAIIDRIDKIK